MHGSNVDSSLPNESRSDGRTAGTMNDPMNAQFTRYQEQIVQWKQQQHQQQLAAHHLRGQQQLVQQQRAFAQRAFQQRAQQQLVQQQQHRLAQILGSPVHNGIWFPPYPSWNWGKKRIVKLGVLLLVEDSTILIYILFFFPPFFLSLPLASGDRLPIGYQRPPILLQNEMQRLRRDNCSPAYIHQQLTKKIIVRAQQLVQQEQCAQQQWAQQQHQHRPRPEVICQKESNDAVSVEVTMTPPSTPERTQSNQATSPRTTKRPVKTAVKTAPVENKMKEAVQQKWFPPSTKQKNWSISKQILKSLQKNALEKAEEKKAALEKAEEQKRIESPTTVIVVLDAYEEN